MRSMSGEQALKTIIGQECYEALFDAVCKRENLQPGDDGTDVERRFITGLTTLIKSFVNNLNEEDVMSAYAIEQN